MASIKHACYVVIFLVQFAILTEDVSHCHSLQPSSGPVIHITETRMHAHTK
jgi:hypothetical protein